MDRFDQEWTVCYKYKHLTIVAYILFSNCDIYRIDTFQSFSDILLFSEYTLLFLGTTIELTYTVYVSSMGTTKCYDTVLFVGVNLAEPGQLLYIVCPDKTVVEDDNSQPVWVTPGTRLIGGDNDGYADVGPGTKLKYL